MSYAARRIFFLSVVLLAVLACTLPITISPTQEPGAAFTSAALTVAAAVNQTLGPSLIPQSSAMQSFTPAVLDTVAPLPTLTATLSPTPIFTSTSSIPLISVSVDTNCRVGPGKVYDYLGGLFVSQTAEVYGKNPAGDYYYIRLPENTSIYCWVTGQYATLVGNTSSLPIFTPPPTPTPVPNFEFAFAGLDSCIGWWVNLRMKNTGPVAFKSYSLTVKDLNTNLALVASGNDFTEMSGCVISTTIASLEPNKVAILSGPVFNYNPNNHKMRATLMLCSLVGLHGQCVTNTIDFRP